MIISAGTSCSFPWGLSPPPSLPVHQVQTRVEQSFVAEVSFQEWAVNASTFNSYRQPTAVAVRNVLSNLGVILLPSRGNLDNEAHKNYIEVGINSTPLSTGNRQQWSAKWLIDGQSFAREVGHFSGFKLRCWRHCPNWLTTDIKADLNWEYVCEKTSGHFWFSYWNISAIGKHEKCWLGNWLPLRKWKTGQKRTGYISRTSPTLRSTLHYAYICLHKVKIM